MGRRLPLLAVCDPHLPPQPVGASIKLPVQALTSPVLRFFLQAPVVLPCTRAYTPPTPVHIQGQRRHLTDARSAVAPFTYPEASERKHFVSRKHYVH